MLRISFDSKGKGIMLHPSPTPVPAITVTGNDAYKAMCADLAAEHNFRVINPELQARIAQQRQVHRREASVSEKQPQRPSRQEKQQPRDFNIID